MQKTELKNKIKDILKVYPELVFEDVFYNKDEYYEYDIESSVDRNMYPELMSADYKEISRFLVYFDTSRDVVIEGTCNITINYDKENNEVVVFVEMTGTREATYYDSSVIDIDTLSESIQQGLQHVSSIACREEYYDFYYIYKKSTTAYISQKVYKALNTDFPKIVEEEAELLLQKSKNYVSSDDIFHTYWEINVNNNDVSIDLTIHHNEPIEPLDYNYIVPLNEKYLK